MANVPPVEICPSLGENTSSSRNVSTGNVCSLSSQVAHSVPEFQTASCDETVIMHLMKTVALLIYCSKYCLFSLCPQSQNIMCDS